MLFKFHPGRGCGIQFVSDCCLPLDTVKFYSGEDKGR